MQNPLVSFCLFVYNQEKYVKEALLGALNQTYSPIEIIISDDCSTDNSFSIIENELKSYTGPHKIILNKNEENLGLVKHVNKILYEVSKGDYIALAAGDDISHPERISESIDFLKNNPKVSALSTSLNLIDENSKLIERQIFDTNSDIIFDVNYYLSKKYKHIYGSSRILKRTLIDAFPKLNEDCHTEDTTFLFRAFLFGKVVLLSKKLVNYRKHDSSISSPEGLRKMNVNHIFNQYYDDLNYSVGKYIDETNFKKLIKKLKKNKDKRTGKKIEKKSRSLKFYTYKFLSKLFLGRYEKLLKAWYDGEKSFPEVLNNIYNSKFPNNNTICLGGSTWSKNFGDALNVPLFNLIYNKNYFESSFTRSNTEEFFMIGSIIHRAKKNTVIWGSGCINDSLDSNVKPKKVYAVRGPLTREILLKNNIDCPEVFGDPALLLPLFYKPIIHKKFRYGILPHYMDKYHKSVREFSKRKDVVLIDIEVGYQNWQDFIDKILQCENIITSSLHGVILADAYNIPNVWGKFTDGVSGNGFKFRDYYLSVSKEINSPIDFSLKIEEELLKTKLIKWKKINFNHKILMDSFPYGNINILKR